MKTQRLHPHTLELNNAQDKQDTIDTIKALCRTLPVDNTKLPFILDIDHASEN